jgi:hypothetical protein
MVRESVPAERWFFYQDNTGLWKWARLDVLGNVLGHSGASFETRVTCIEHARQSGYDDERRPELGLAVPQDPPSQSASLRTAS